MTIEKKIFAFFATYNNVIENNKWFVAYHVPDYKTGKFRKRKYLGQINKYDTVEERYNECTKIKLLIEQNKPLPDFRGARRLQPNGLERNFASVILLLNSVLDERKVDINNTTYINYKSIISTLDLYLKSKLMDKLSIGNFTEEIARDFLHQLKVNGIANKTYNNYRVILSSLWKDIMRRLRDSIRIENHWHVIKSLKKNTQPFKVYTTEIEKIVVSNLPKFDNQLWLFIQFTHYGFIRGTENRKLKISSINFINKTITIDAKISKVAEQRIITIPDQLYIEIMKAKLNECHKDFYIFSSKGFPSEKPAGKNYFSIRWSKFREAYSISNEYKIYPFKHTGMIKALQNGVDIKLIQKQAGHHSLDQVNDYLAAMNSETLHPLRDNFPKLGEIPNKNNEQNEIKEMLSKILEKMEN